MTRWQNLSLQSRLTVSLSAMLLGTLAICVVALLMFSRVHLIQERAPAVQEATEAAQALNAALAAASDPEPVLKTLAASLNGGTASLRFEETGATPQTPIKRFDTVPTWFEHLVQGDMQTLRIPVQIKGETRGHVVADVDVSADVYEKWVAFLTLIVLALLIIPSCALIASMTVRSTLQPLHAVSNVISELYDGNYDARVAGICAPELQRSCRQLDALGSKLKTLADQNRNLLTEIVSAQDMERKEISRDLHDELGPLLFALRSNIAGLEMSPLRPEVLSRVEIIAALLEQLHESHRRILDRVKPAHLEELGLVRSLRSLADSPALIAAQVEASCHLDAAIDQVSDLVAETAYRVVQEAVTNVVRHAGARNVSITANVTRADDSPSPMLKLAVIDDGHGKPNSIVPGRGLKGMSERVLALGGRLSLDRRNEKFIVSCDIPLDSGSGGKPVRARLAALT
ncbi:histidine kinase [Bradyrhizobium sp. SYSU BS000235]|uniref:histidine kinase n=1 Tax=Bradyrhizobium sp. SYSU BS000235 TaxID=3411332 RepID=UPI003C7443C6